MNIDEKYTSLQGILHGHGKIAVAYSGGVDSAFLSVASVETLGAENVLAVTIDSQVLPRWELEMAESIAAKFSIRHIVVPSNCMDDEPFTRNAPDRCYHCKKGEFGDVITIAKSEGFNIVADGSNADDVKDYRPGMKATKELGVISPLKEVGLTKPEIRTLSERLGIPGYDRPAAACLASRIPYNSVIDTCKLAQVETAEDALRRLGFTHVRVRHHGDVARVEIPPDKFADAVASHEKIVRDLKAAGFTHVALDLAGYRTGSLNESLYISLEYDKRED